jgi:hypothetical protein
MILAQHVLKERLAAALTAVFVVEWNFMSDYGGRVRRAVPHRRQPLGNAVEDSAAPAVV